MDDVSPSFNIEDLLSQQPAHIPMPEPTAEQIDRHFSAMDDSVALIDELVGAAPGEFQTEEDLAAAIRRNVEHLELMLEKEFVKNSGRPLAAYTAAIAKGRA